MLTTFKLVPRPQSFCHILSCLLTPYHTLSHFIPLVGKKSFSIGNLKISSQVPNFLSHFITPCYSLSHLIILYPLGLRKKHFHLATLKLVPRPLISYHILSRLLTPYHTLSHFIPLAGKKSFPIGNLKISSQVPNFLSHLITPSHSLAHLITPYPLGLRKNHFHLATLKLVPRPPIS